MRGFVLLQGAGFVERYFACSTRCRYVVKGHERYAEILGGFLVIALAGKMLKPVAALIICITPSSHASCPGSTMDAWRLLPDSLRNSWIYTQSSVGRTWLVIGSSSQRPASQRGPCWPADWVESPTGAPECQIEATPTREVTVNSPQAFREIHLRASYGPYKSLPSMDVSSAAGTPTEKKIAKQVIAS